MFNSCIVLLLIIIVNTFLTGVVHSQLQCKDEENNAVDWFVIYKIPKISQTSNPLIRKGEAYIYITSKDVNIGWKVSNKSIVSPASIPGYTLAPLYQKNDSLLWTLYNDQPPNKTAVATNGHTKGVVTADVRQGFWLIHSVPHYPPSPSHGTNPSRKVRLEKSTSSHRQSDQQYDYPASGKHYGQSFLCISVNKDQLDVIGKQLMYNQIIPYKNNIPQQLAEQYAVLSKAANKIRVKSAPYNHKTLIKSLGGVEFLSFAKSDKWEKELYEDFVAPQLGIDLVAETWPNSRDKLPSDCSGLKVMNVKSIYLETVNTLFKSTLDHSKWAVSSSGNKNRTWVCVGDINRARAQSERGGGTVCLNSQKIWKSYHDIVNDVEPCPKK